ncbi:MAG: alpha/beta fold hydrolase [Chitinophagaceae bacterium]|nr:alpha/beta fold hydrolase [Chitinophagaceae bacterium]MBP6590229.1 alpha/beta fold hydrolase [Chitinophagaceae bacterium]MBP8243835.1 alpha/beta fold hydrolase [Chitinophagaceae bacterium]
MEKKPLRQQIRSVLRWTGWVLLVQFLLINISTAFYADKLTRFYTNLPEGYSNSSGNIFTKSWKLFTGPRYPRSSNLEAPVFAIDTVRLQTKQGLAINAWYAPADTTAKGTVILFHGIGGSKMTLIDEVNEFRYLGYNIMMVDFRGHGNSEGNRTTIGYREAEEVRLAYDFVRQKGEQHIFIYGSSMGAVSVARAVYLYEMKLSGLILEMPFYSLQTYLKARAAQIGFPAQPFAFFTSFWIGLEKGFNGYKHKTTRYAAAIKCPVLLTWGTLDHYVNEKEIRTIYEAIPGPHKRLVVYEGASHESLLRKDPEKWRTSTESFLQSPGQ